MSKLIHFVSLMCFSFNLLAADDPVLKGLKSINEALRVLNGKAKPSQTTTSKNTPPSILDRAQLSEKQKLQLEKQCDPKNHNSHLKQAITEANPVIKKVLEMQACFYPANSYGLYQKRSGYFHGLQGHYFRYHDKSRCANIQRVSEWKLQAKNALAFRSMYVSEQSGESQDRTYLLEKQLDGTWLFR